MSCTAERIASRQMFVVAALGAALALPAAAAAQSRPTDTPFGALAWRSIGPYIGGRVVAVTGVTGNSNLFYSGAVDGGIWKSTDYGIRWTNISDGTLPGTSASIGALAVAASNPSVLYAGTGESDIRGDMITGDGVFRSDDAGKSWHAAGLAATHTISRLIVDPANPDVVYASSMGHVFTPDPNRGVFKSADGGRSWQKVLFVNDSTGVIDLVIDPRHPKVLYAAAWQAYRKPWNLTSGGAGSGLYKTVDGGAHWTNLTKNPGLPMSVLGKIGIAVAPSAPNVVYAAIQAHGGGVFRSQDAGGTWTRVNRDWKLRQRAFYYTAIFADPRDSNTVYMPEVDALFVSRNGAKTFDELHTPHGDNHIVWVNPDDPQILLEGNDGGATVSTDGGMTWSGEHNQPTGQFYSVNLDHQFPFNVYGAQQDEGSVGGPSASPNGTIQSSAWHRTSYGESTPSVPQPGDPHVTFGSGYFSIFLTYDDRTGEFRSVSPWPDYQEGSSSAELKYRLAWTHPIIFSSANPNELLVGSQYVLKSDDRGRTWAAISPDLTRNDPSTEVPSGGPVDLDQSGAEIFPYVSALAMSPIDAGVIWAGSSDGLVHVTTDGGAHWNAVTPMGLPQWSDVSSIEPSHSARGTAYVTAQGYMLDDFAPHVFKTSDFGTHWTALTNGLPGDEYAFVIREDPGDSKLLFLGTKTTVYTSMNGGSSWQPLSLNLPPVQVRDIAIDTRQGALAIATHGRAFWVLDNLSLLEQATNHPSVPAQSAALFAPGTAWLSHAYGAPDNPRAGVGAGQNPPFGAEVFFHIPASYDGKTPVSLSFTDSSGRVIRAFELHGKRKDLATRDSVRVVEEMTPDVRKAAAFRKLTAIAPGMNRFQWDLRYPDATEVNGFYVPVPAGGLPDAVSGPVVAPGTYRVVLDYGGATSQQTFRVALDPRLHATPADLQARLALQMQIHNTLDTLDQTIDRAIAVRDSLATEVESHRVTDSRASAVSAPLNTDILAVADLDSHSSEGPLLHESKLRDHLAYLQGDIDLAYARPTPAHYAVFQQLRAESLASEQQLRSATTAARAVLKGPS